MLSPTRTRAYRIPLNRVANVSQRGWQGSPRPFLLSRRFVSGTAPPELPKQRPKLFRRVITIAKFGGYFALSSVAGVLAIGAGIFIHDAFTYTDKHIDRVPVSPLALYPQRGGPKNLPVVRVQVDDEQDEANRQLANKPRLVIVGGGWGVCYSLKMYYISLANSPVVYGNPTNAEPRRLSYYCHCA